VFTFGVSFTMDTILFTLETVSLLERIHSFVFITVKTHESLSRHLQKTMLVHKIATPRPAVELARLHHVSYVTQLEFDPVEQIAETLLVHAES